MPESARRARPRALSRTMRSSPTRPTRGRPLARGEHVIVTTGTARGKTLAFNLPVLDALAPSRRTARSISTRRRRSRRISGALRAEARGPRGDLRRRHGRRATTPDPPVGESRADEPGHAPHRRDAAPRPLGRLAREPPLRRRRRGARVPRRVRLACRERPAAPAPRWPRSTAPSRSSCSPRRRSRTRASSRSALLGDEATVVEDDAAPRAERTVVALEPASCSTRSSAPSERARRSVAPARRARRAAASARSASRRAASPPS